MNPSDPEAALEEAALEDEALSGASEAALARFATLQGPSPQARRWAGVALLWQAQHDAARRMLESALQGGERGAHIHLAYLHRVRGEFGYAEAQLRAMGEVHDPLDKALAAREQAHLLFARDRLREAAQRLEEGWQVTYATAHGSRLRPGMALLQGLILYTLGDHRGALHWLDAALDGGSGQQVYAQGWRAATLARLDRADEARSALDEARTLAAQVPVSAALHEYQRGVTLRVLGETAAAQAALQASVALAETRNEHETLAVALQLLIGLHFEGDPHAPGLTLHLERASAHCRSPATRALVQWRRAQVQREPGLSGARALEASAGALHALERCRDAVCAGLGAVEAYLEADEGLEAERCLNTVLGWAQGLGPVHLGPELRSLPGVKRALSCLPKTHPAHPLIQDPLAHLRVQVLGEAGLTLNGVRLNLGYRQAPQTLYYLMRHPGVALSTLVQTLNPDEVSRQARVNLSAMLTRLKKTGHLQYQNTLTTGVCLQWSGVEVSCDALELRDALKRGALEDALDLYRPPQAEGEWVQQEVGLLLESLLLLGTATLGELLERGSYTEAAAGLSSCAANRTPNHARVVAPKDMLESENCLSGTAYLSHKACGFEPLPALIEAVLQDSAARLRDRHDVCLFTDGESSSATLFPRIFGVPYVPTRMGRPGRPPALRSRVSRTLAHVRIVKHRSGQRLERIEVRQAHGTQTRVDLERERRSTYRKLQSAPAFRRLRPDAYFSGKWAANSKQSGH